MRNIVIVGAGGFGREVYSLLMSVNRSRPTWNVVGFADDSPSVRSLQRLRALGATYLGPIADSHASVDAGFYVVAIGSPRARQEVVGALSSGDEERFPVLIHPDATVGDDVRLGAGTVVAAGARITTAVRTGVHVHIDQNATLAHDSHVGDFGRLNPSATVSGSVTIGRRSTVGANATVLQNLCVGDDSFIGAGAVVIRDVPDGATAVGVPARWVSDR